MVRFPVSVLQFGRDTALAANQKLTQHLSDRFHEHFILRC